MMGRGGGRNSFSFRGKFGIIECKKGRYRNDLVWKTRHHRVAQENRQQSYRECYVSGKDSRGQNVQEKVTDAEKG